MHIEITDTAILVHGPMPLGNLLEAIHAIADAAGFEFIDLQLATQYGCTMYITTNEHSEAERQRIGGTVGFDLPKDWAYPICPHCGSETFYEHQLNYSKQTIRWSERYQDMEWGLSEWCSEAYSNGMFCSECDHEVPTKWFKDYEMRQQAREQGGKK